MSVFIPPISIGLFLVLLSLPIALSGQTMEEDWGEPKRHGDYLIYSRFEGDSPIKKVKMTGLINVDMESVIYVLGAVDEYTEWIYGCTYAKTVSRKSELDFSYYLLMDFPFPMSDRDLEVDAHHHTDPFGVWKGITRASQNPSVEISEGVIRIVNYCVTWELDPMPDQKTRFEYTISMDLGGYIPHFLINEFLLEAPVKTIRALESQSRKKARS